jgi:hypothetical protein
LLPKGYVKEDGDICQNMTNENEIKDFSIGHLIGEK